MTNSQSRTSRHSFFRLLLVAGCLLTPSFAGADAAAQCPRSPDRQRGPTKVIKPEYPKLALQQSVEGHVDIEFTVEPDGSVSGPKVAAEEPKQYGFAEAAMAVFPGWKFTIEITKDCEPIAARAFFRMTFKIPKGDNGSDQSIP